MFKSRMNERKKQSKNQLIFWLKKIAFFLFFLIKITLSITLGQTSAQSSVKILSNGLQLIIDQNPHSQTTAVFILINGGKLADPPGKAGLGYLVTRLSLDPPDTDFLRQFMKVGAEVKVASRGDFLMISIECLSNNFDSTMKLIYRTFSRPIFSSIRVNSLKEVLKNNQKRELDDVDSRADLALLEAFFGFSNYGLSGYGNQQTVENFKSDDASAYHRKYFVGANMIMSVVSNLDSETVTAVIESTFGRLPKGESFQVEPPSFQIPEEKEIRLKKEITSALLAIAFPLPPLSTRNFVLANFLEAIMGRGPGSRIWPLRGEEGLAYEAASRVILMKGGGLFIIYLKTMAEKISEARIKFQKRLKEIADQGLNEEDLMTGRNFFRLWLYKQLEAKRKRAELQAKFIAFGFNKELVEDSLEAYCSNLSLNDLADFFKKVFNLKQAVLLEIIPVGDDSVAEKNQRELPFWPAPGNQTECLQIQDK